MYQAYKWKRVHALSAKWLAVTSHYLFLGMGLGFLTTAFSDRSFPFMFVAGFCAAYS